MSKYKSNLFPDIVIAKRGLSFLTKYPDTLAKNPFNIQTGELLVGDYKGRTLDQVFKEDPGYLFRMSYYWSSVWSIDHKAAFLYWTKVI